MKIKQLKAELTSLAATIKKFRPIYKQRQRDGLPLYDAEMRPYYDAHFGGYREKHIAYCLLRGTPYEKIETKVRPGNEPNWPRIKKIMEVYREQPEAVRDCAG